MAEQSVRPPLNEIELARKEVKEMAEEWFSNIDLDDMFLVNHWRT